MTSLTDQIPDGWRAALAGAVAEPSFRRLDDFLETERARTDTAIYPPPPDVFAALRLTPLASVRAVILGQDPYHGDGQAHGLAFSVPVGVAPPPSLRNILAEWESDLGLARPAGGSLERWARHGVLLLNAVMTVRQGKANSHKDEGWEPFTDAIIRVVAAKRSPVVFLLWGRTAQRKIELIDGRHVVLESDHPSPLSANRPPTPLLGSKPFSKSNARLEALGWDPIDWRLNGSV